MCVSMFVLLALLALTLSLSNDRIGYSLIPSPKRDALNAGIYICPVLNAEKFLDVVTLIYFTSL